MDFIEERRPSSLTSHLSLLENELRLLCKDTVELMLDQLFKEIRNYVSPMMSQSNVEVVEFNNQTIDYYIYLTHFTVHYLVMRSEKTDNVVVLYEDDKRSEINKIRVATGLPTTQNQPLTKVETILKIREITEKIEMIKRGEKLRYEHIVETQDGIVPKGTFIDVHSFIYDTF